MTRDPTELDARFWHLFRAWRATATSVIEAADKKRGVTPAVIVIHETRRAQARQNELFAQGRTRPGTVVTWTRDSLHQYGLALDWHFQRDGAAIWRAESYAWIYRAVPPERYGIEPLRGTEWVHLQIVAGDAMRKHWKELGLRRT